MKILVTGAGGFIGGWVTDTLHLTGRAQVRAGVRSWSGAARPGRLPVEIVRCDVLDSAEVSQAVEGADAVVHCAAGPGPVITRGTGNILEASLRAGVKRVVHLSTIDVYGGAEGRVDESTPLKHTDNAYGNAKIDAEGLCAEFGRKGLPVVILRPTIVYGPYCKLWIAKFAERLQSGHWGTFDGLGEGLCNLVYVRDLVEAIFLALDSDAAVGQAFNINGADIITWNQYFQRFSAALGLPPLQEIGTGRSQVASTLSMPARSIARFVVGRYGTLATRLYQRNAMIRRIMQGTERSLRTTPTTGELKMFGLKAHYLIDRATEVLGYRPQYTVDAGLEMSVRWLRHEYANPDKV